MLFFLFFQIQNDFPPDIIETLVLRQVPDANGAMGRNRSGYIHARFQFRMHYLVEYTLKKGDLRGVELFLRALEYTFQFQKPAGDFEFHVPDGLADSPTPAELASGTAFFMASAGMGLWQIQRSTYLEAIPKAEWVSIIKQSKRAMAYLASSFSALVAIDDDAPNRLFVNALAFSSFGHILEDENLLQMGSYFKDLALASQSADGFFIEGGGYDSSYNGVSIAIGFRLLKINPNDHELEVALCKASQWQGSRVLKNGFVRWDGNTRVYPGGEDFLGTEKSIDYAHCLDGLASAWIWTQDPFFWDTANRVLDYIQIHP